MMDAPVLRTPSFREALNFFHRNEFGEALDRLYQMRHQYADDQNSRVEIDQYIAWTLEGMGKTEEALALLLNLQPQLFHLQHDLSLHYFSLVSLLQKLKRQEQLQTFCQGINDPYKPEDALGHLDWILRYAESGNDPEPTEFMRGILILCASRLGLGLLPEGLVGDGFRSTVRDYCIARDEANNRYGSFWHEHRRLAASNAPQAELHEHVRLFIASEPTPVFQEIARGFYTESNVCASPNDRPKEFSE